MAAATSSSRTSSSVPNRVSWAPMCQHGLPTDILTSHTERNPGRRFFCCQVRKYDDCDFSQWVDASTPVSFCRNFCERRLRMEQEDFQRQLQVRADAESLLTEKLKMKAEECELLKLKVQKLKMKFEDMEAANEKKWFRVCVVMLVFIVFVAIVYV